MVFNSSRIFMFSAKMGLLVLSLESTTVELQITLPGTGTVPGQHIDKLVSDCTYKIVLHYTSRYLH
jgi:hypothetical protein